jgi:hypothetical protein
MAAPDQARAIVQLKRMFNKVESQKAAAVVGAATRKINEITANAKAAEARGEPLYRSPAASSNLKATAAEWNPAAAGAGKGGKRNHKQKKTRRGRKAKRSNRTRARKH